MAMRAKDKPKRERKYRWFVEPLNNETREKVLITVSEEDIYLGRICADDKPRNLCEVKWKMISFLVKSRINNSFLQFEVWVQVGEGKVRKWPFLGKRYRQKELTRGDVKLGREVFPQRPR